MSEKKYSVEALEKARQGAIERLKKADELASTSPRYAINIPQLVSEALSILEMKCPICWHQNPTHDNECPDASSVLSFFPIE